MDNRSKVISGLGRRPWFDVPQRHQIIQEFLSSGCTKKEIYAKYTGGIKHHGEIVRWMRRLGYIAEHGVIKPNFAQNKMLMSKRPPPEEIPNDSFEYLQLKKRVAELENQLKDAEMKAIAFSTMIDIAEKEFSIPIRKKANTKPLKK